MKILYTAILSILVLQLNAAAPTVPASNLHFNAIDGGYFNLGWTAGNGLKRIIICKAGSAVTFVPQNGIDYTENTEFGSGQQVAPGEYVVYDNAFTSFYLTGLSPATQYFFAIFEYNGSGAGIEYLTSTFLTGQETTSAAPTVQTGNAVFSAITNNSVTVTVTKGNGARRLIVVREGSAVNADPVNSVAYAVNSAFGSGAQIGAGNYAVYNSTDISTVVTNLKAGTDYFFAFYEFNGSSQPQYLAPAYVAAVTTRSIPTTSSSNVIITKADGKELSLSWTNGNGQRRIIIAKQGNDITSVPADGVNYSANATFGSGTQLNAGEYVVFNDNFHEATVSGLNPATTYYFKIYEYDGTGSNTAYLTSSFAVANGSTAATPAIQATSFTASAINATSATLQWTAGNGRARLIVGKKNGAVDINPQNFSLYTDDNAFGNGQDIGNGNFAISNSTTNFITVSNLEPNTTYHFAAFEYNGFNQPLYLSPAAALNITTSSVLPVKLTKWEATLSGDRVKLQWATETEMNSSRFIIERSNDGSHFTAISEVKASGNSQSTIHYSAEDNNPLNGKSYYRLKIADIDETFEYSAVKIINNNTEYQVTILNNPVNSKLVAIVPGSISNGNAEWQIIAVGGQVIQRGKIASNRIETNVSALPAGQYWLRLFTTKDAQLKVFVKQ